MQRFIKGISTSILKLNNECYVTSIAISLTFGCLIRKLKFAKKKKNLYEAQINMSTESWEIFLKPFIVLLFAMFVFLEVHKVNCSFS